MTELHLHPDGRIFIRGSTGSPQADYEATLTDFQGDNAAAFPPLPDGMSERIYAPGERHVLADAKGNAHPQAMPWAPGDAILAKLAALREARAAREAPPPPSPRQPALTIESLAAALRAKGVLTAAEIESAKT